MSNANEVFVIVTGERAEEWRQVFGTEKLPVVSPLPEYANLPGFPAELVYRLDVDRLTVEQRNRLIPHLARKFGLDVAEVAAGLREIGCPLRAEGLMMQAWGPRWLPL